MFQGGFKEAGENSATFPEDTEESFDLLIEWIYTGSVRPLKYKTLEVREWNYNVVNAYALAEKLCAFDLADGILESLRLHQRGRGGFFGLGFVQQVYEKTESNSPFRRYATDAQAYVFIADTKPEVDSLWPTKTISNLMASNENFRDDFLARLRTISFSPLVRLPDPREGPICNYHRHGKTEVCPIKKAS
jgi:hypothetical protein